MGILDWLSPGRRNRSSNAIVFKPIYPPRHVPGHLTYFGGDPTLSRALAWPLGPQTGEPITFVGQVDLAKLPDVPLRSTLPPSGVLHFFANNDDFGESAVLFSDVPAEQLVETRPPDNAPDLYASYPLSRTLAWALSAVPRRDAYPKWLVEPVACPTHSPDEPELSEETFARMFPAPQPTALLPPFPKDNTADLWIPDATFPYLWAYVESWCKLLLEDGSYLYLTKDQKQEPGIARECAEWIAKAQSRGPLTRTTANDVGEFWNWVRSIDTRVRTARPGATIADYGLSIAKGTATPADRAALVQILKRPEMVWRNALQTIPQQAERIASGALGGQEANSFLEWLDGMVRAGGGPQPMNQTTRSTLREVTNLLLGYGHDVTGAIPPAAIEANTELHWPRAAARHQMFGHLQIDRGSSRTEHLLMQFSSSKGMYWTWGDVGEFLFWIRDADLKSRRFDRVIGEIECS